MPTKPVRVGSLAAIAGYAFTAVALVAIAVLVVPESVRSNEFWYRVAWLEVLLLICWGVLGGFFVVSLDGQRKFVGGLAPAFGSVLIGYSILSASLLGVTSWMPAAEILSTYHLPAPIVPIAELLARYHLPLQIALAAGAFSILAIMSMALSAQVAGTQTNGITPIQLGSALAACEQTLAKGEVQNDSLAEAARALKDLRNAITHSLPQAGIFLASSGYIEFVSEVEAFCKLIDRETAEGTAPLTTESLRLIVGKAKTLHTKTAALRDSARVG